MAVAYIPAVLEGLSTFHKERANGLYGPLPFTLSNFLIGLPYLFLISITFSVIAYWLSNFRPIAVSFWTWVMWLFLDLLAAEGLVVLVTCVVPIFVVAPAVTAFCERAVDVCRWIYGTTGDIKCFPEICLPLHRLPSLCLSGHDGKSLIPTSPTLMPFSPLTSNPSNLTKSTGQWVRKPKLQLRPRPQLHRLATILQHVPPPTCSPKARSEAPRY
jgi:hypothetical protein